MLDNRKEYCKNSAFKYQQLIENLPIIMYCIEDNHFTYLNPTALNVFGYTEKEIKELNWWDIVHPDFQDQLIERNKKRVKNEPVEDHYQIKIIDENKQEKWLEILNARIVLDGLTNTIAAAIDITDRKKMEVELEVYREELETRVQQRTSELNSMNTALTVSNRMLDSIIQNSSEGVIIIEPNGEIGCINKKAQAIIGRYGSDCISNAIKNGNTIIAKMIFAGLAFQDEEILTSHGEEDVHFVASGTPVKDEYGNIHRALIFVRPIKEVTKLINRFTGAQARFDFPDILTNNKRFLEMIKLAKVSASTESNILLEGESGTGKELFAQAIHKNSQYSNGPFVAVNCGAIPRELIASELFGYSEGAFTGAKKGGNPGKFELASGGTIFLDEIGDMPLEQQTSLLRVIQERKLERIGGNRVIPINVRIICATNKNLYEEVAKGKFRQDLYYRLNVISIKIPPLRQRPDDITLLFKCFLRQKYGFDDVNISNINPLVFEYLQKYQWPGNVRELQNVTERIVNVAQDKQIDLIHLPIEIINYEPEITNGNQQAGISQQLEEEAKTRTRELLEKVERGEIVRLLNKHNGNVSEVAKEIGVNRRTIYRKIKAYGIKK